MTDPSIKAKSAEIEAGMCTPVRPAGGMREALAELYEFARGLNDFRVDSRLARKVQSALAAQPAPSSPVSNETWMATVRECNEAREEVRRLREASDRRVPVGKEDWALLAHEIDEARKAYLDGFKQEGNAERKAKLEQLLWDDKFTIIEALKAASTLPPQDGLADPTNHHNALKCPYCNPNGIVAERAAVIEECAKFVEQHQERITETSNGSERSVSPRMAGNQMGLAYAAAIRALAPKGAADGTVKVSEEALRNCGCPSDRRGTVGDCQDSGQCGCSLPRAELGTGGGK